MPGFERCRGIPAQTLDATIPCVCPAPCLLPTPTSARSDSEATSKLLPKTNKGFPFVSYCLKFRGQQGNHPLLFFDLSLCIVRKIEGGRMKHFVVVTTCCSVHTLGVKGKSVCGHNECALAKVSSLVVTSSAWRKGDLRWENNVFC